jgi:hypothetical protein
LWDSQLCQAILEKIARVYGEIADSEEEREDHDELSRQTPTFAAISKSFLGFPARTRKEH